MAKTTKVTPAELSSKLEHELFIVDEVRCVSVSRSLK